VNAADLISGAEKAVAVLKVLKPLADEVSSWFDGGPQPDFLDRYPSELKATAALERLRYRASRKAQP